MLTADTGDRIDAILTEATGSGRLPGVTFGVFDRAGVQYQGAFGSADLSTGTPMALDSVVAIMSMTKPLAGVACLQLVETGLLDLDQPAREILPELGDVAVLGGFDGDQPILRAPRTEITLRNLLTHSSGFVYEIWNANQAHYLSVTGRSGVSGGTRADYHQPLAFDPGDRWEYGIGIDWAGMMAEAVTGIALEDLMARRIFEPLGMVDTSYRLSDAMAARRATLHTRNKEGRFRASTADPIGKDREFNGGGGGLFSTLDDYGRFVRMILNGGELDGVRILSPEMVATASVNQMGDLRVTMLPSNVQAASADAEFFPGVPKGWGLSFQINLEDAPTGRSAGSLSWAGLDNTFFWIDPIRGIGGVFLTQTLPFADADVLSVADAAEAAVYDGLR